MEPLQRSIFATLIRPVFWCRSTIWIGFSLELHESSNVSYGPKFPWRTALKAMAISSLWDNVGLNVTLAEYPIGSPVGRT